MTNENTGILPAEQSQALKPMFPIYLVREAVRKKTADFEDMS